MSSITASPATGIRSWPAWAAASIGVAVVLTAIGTFWSPLASYEASRDREEFLTYLVVVATILIGAALVFGLVVRTATPASAERRGLILALVSVPSIVVFWTGLPTILAGGAACCALANGRPSTTGKVILGLAILVTGFAVWAALAG